MDFGLKGIKVLIFSFSFRSGRDYIFTGSSQFRSERCYILTVLMSLSVAKDDFFFFYFLMSIRDNMFAFFQNIDFGREGISF